jgi:hypothetical protein
MEILVLRKNWEILILNEAENRRCLEKISYLEKVFKSKNHHALKAVSSKTKGNIKTEVWILNYFYGCIQSLGQLQGTIQLFALEEKSRWQRLN